MRTGLTPIQWLMVVLVGMLIGGVIMYAVYSGAIEGLTDIVNRSADQASSQDPLGSSFQDGTGPMPEDGRPVPVDTGPPTRAGVI